MPAITRGSLLSAPSCRVLSVLLLLCCLSWSLPSELAGEENRPREVQAARSRVVFIGDSITGQGGGWQGTGYVFKIREALEAVVPGAKPDLVPLGGSGMGVGAWLGLTKSEERQKHELDVRGVQVAAALAQPADILIVMLGMNDVLAPYVNESDASLDQWLANYKELVTLLSAKLKPKVIGLAMITPQTEDVGTPKNKVMARMNERLTKLAAELKARVLPTNQMYWKVLEEGRKRQADFTLAGDRIHPGAAGHMAVALGMLAGLGEENAATWLLEEKIAKVMTGLKPAQPPIEAPPAWLVANGLVLKAWQEWPHEEDLELNGIDDAIEKGGDFWQAPVKAGAEPLVWRRFQSSINLTDGANAGSVDFAGVTFGQNFEAGYGARWIRCDEERSLNMEVKSSGIGSVIHLTTWLNGERVYADLITKEPKRRAMRPVKLRKGWNVLVFKSCHRTWQWQQAISLLEPDGGVAKGLEYRAEPPP